MKTRDSWERKENKLDFNFFVVESNVEFVRLVSEENYLNLVYLQKLAGASLLIFANKQDLGKFLLNPILQILHYSLPQKS